MVTLKSETADILVELKKPEEIDFYHLQELLADLSDSDIISDNTNKKVNFIFEEISLAYESRSNFYHVPVLFNYYTNKIEMLKNITCDYLKGNTNE